MPRSPDSSPESDAVSNSGAEHSPIRPRYAPARSRSKALARRPARIPRSLSPAAPSPAPDLGCGFQLGCGTLADPSSLRSCSIPLESIGASSGSHTTIFVSGRSFASTRSRMRFPTRVRNTRRSVLVTLLLDPARKHWRVVRLAYHDLCLRPLLRQHPRHALQSASGTESRNPVVQPLVLEIPQDLLCRRARVDVGIGFILKLACVIPSVLLRQFDGLLHHSYRPPRGRRDHHLGAQESHQLAALDAEGLRHCHHQRVTLRRAYHGKPNTGVPASRLHHGLPRLQLPCALRLFDNTQGEPVLNRPQRVERLHFHKQIHARGRQPIDSYHRSIANCFRDVCELTHSLTSD